MSSTAEGIVVLAGVFVLVLLLMYVGWRRRGSRSGAAVGDLPEVPGAGELGAALTPPLPATYVSTTTAGDWLDRVVAHDLGVRSAARVAVHPTGVLIERTGARDVFVPAARLEGVRREPGMAGKYVGRDGLVVIRWTADSPTSAPTTSGSTSSGSPTSGSTTLDTGLRLRHAADRDSLTAAVSGLVPHRPAARPSSEEKS